jgi:hypothetical protein
MEWLTLEPWLRDHKGPVTKHSEVHQERLERLDDRHQLSPAALLLPDHPDRALFTSCWLAELYVAYNSAWQLCHHPPPPRGAGHRSRSAAATEAGRWQNPFWM